jgi:hypothetical protein
MVPTSTLKPESAGSSASKGPRAAGVAMALFIAWTFLPLAHRGLRLFTGGDAPEPGKDVKRPTVNGRPLSDFLRDFSVYYQESSPTRKWLITKYSVLKLYFLRTSSVSSVVIGRDHWLFLGEETAKIDERRYFMGIHPFEEETLNQWLRVLTERQRWLERRGIAYWLVVVPNKSTIYPEKLPAFYPLGRRTRMDQLVEFMERHAPGFPLLDLRPVLRAGKKERLLYWPTDTHWNDLGRYLAYREIVRKLADRFPSLAAIPEDAFEIKPSSKSSFDLENLLLMPWETPGPFFHLVPKRPLPAYSVSARDKADTDRVEIFRSKKGRIPLALIIHDSFGNALKLLMSTHFRKSKWILDRSHVLPAEWIVKKRPRLVIDEIVERYLEEDPWSNPAELGDPT